MTNKEKLAKIEYVLKGIPVSKEQKDAIKDILNDGSNDRKDRIVYKFINDNEFYINDILCDPSNFKMLYKHLMSLNPMGTFIATGIEDSSMIALQYPYFIAPTNNGISLLIMNVQIEVDGGGTTHVYYQNLIDLDKDDYEE